MAHFTKYLVTTGMDREKIEITIPVIETYQEALDYFGSEEKVIEIANDRIRFTEGTRVRLYERNHRFLLNSLRNWPSFGVLTLADKLIHNINLLMEADAIDLYNAFKVSVNKRK